jgi:succinate-acetate transporter protein
MRPVTSDPGATRIVLRPLASPLPVGFLALAVGSFTLAGLQLGWVSMTQRHSIALCILAFVVPLQVVSFVLGLLARDQAVGTGMGLLTGTWFAIGLVLLGSKPGQVSGGLGLTLVAAAAALAIPVAVAAMAKPIASLVIGTTVLRFATAGAYELTDDATWKSVTGVIGVVLAVLAWYAAAALSLEDSAHRPLLPTLRRRSFSEVSADVSTPPELATSAGVREVL